MIAITPDQRREHREATAQAMLAIDRINRLYVVTGRPYRVRLESYSLPVAAPVMPPADDWQPDSDDDDIDAPRPREMAEDESGA
jgi:hypothetical protein